MVECTNLYNDIEVAAGRKKTNSGKLKWKAVTERVKTYVYGSPSIFMEHRIFMVINSFNRNPWISTNIY